MAAAVVGGGAGVDHGELLVRYADAVLSRDSAAICHERDQVIARLGPKQAVDAAGVIASFNAIVRLSDASGIQLEDFKQDSADEIRRFINGEASDRA